LCKQNPYMKKLNLLLSYCLLVLAQCACAQSFSTPDIWPGSGNSYPIDLTSFNGKVYFVAQKDTVSTGYELYVSDGTTAGTHLVKDINPGAASSNPYYLTVANGKLYFQADDGVHGAELWSSDGTSAGTAMVADIGPGASSSYPYCMTSFNGKLYFTANDTVHGYELWVSDGTAAGTAMLKDINPGSNSSRPIGYIPLAGTYGNQYNEYNNKLYFTADDGIHGSELWSTDGTSIGTTMVADILVGPGSSDPFFMIPINGKLLFSASDSVDGYELYITDGTAAGTSMLKNIDPNAVNNYAGGDPADYTGFIPMNGKLYFSAYQPSTGYELWSTDGTTAGTAMIADIYPGPSSSGPGNFYNMFVYNNKLYFNATDATDSIQLWESDGTAAGTSKVKVLSAYKYPANPSRFIEYNGQMIFTAAIDSVNQYQLWTSDGTSGGTHVISPAVAPNANPLGYDAVSMAVAGGKLFMNADYNSSGDELWVYGFPTGITEAAADHTITVYPNPFSTSVTISGLISSERYAVQVLDLSGREYYSTELDQATDQVSITMPTLAAGVYLMRVSGQSSTQTYKLIKD
jgi:ELWxxDGT repeat protein